MGTTKTTLFTEQQNRLALLAKALAHPARIAILDYLLKTEKCICGDIVNELSLSQPTISQHLRELKNAGFIKGTIEGSSICYCVDETSLELLQNYFFEISKIMKIKNAICC